VLTKETPSVGLEVHVCRPTAPPATGGCATAEVPALPTNAAVVCCPSDTAACESPWKSPYPFASSAELNDTRGCECRCSLDADSGACAAGALKLGATYTGMFGSCKGGDDASAAACRPIADYGTAVRLGDDPKPDVSKARCVPQAAPTGGVGFSAPPLFLCCLRSVPPGSHHVPVARAPVADLASKSQRLPHVKASFTSQEEIRDGIVSSDGYERGLVCRRGSSVLV
jgi:hypothetical protein